MISIKAKPDQAEVVAKLLKEAVEMATEQKQTLSWYSFRIDKDTFGIFDSFNDEAGREAYLTGEIAKALKDKTEVLLVQPPETTKIEILSSK